jgi:glycosyltransferase involved in cell wall biosynthesis
MKLFLLIPYPVKESPSQRFRFEQYFPLLTTAGITYRYQSFWDLRAWRMLYKKGHTVQKVMGFVRGVLRRMFVPFLILSYDMVFIHRETMPVGPPMLEWFIARVLRKKIIYDFDDAIWLPNTSDANSIAARIKWHSKVAAICQWSYKVSCGNAYLADYARQFTPHVVINPTTIDTDHLHNPALYPPQPPRTVTTIGWTGSHSTLKYLDDIVPVLQTLEARHGNSIEFVVIADKAPTLALKHFRFVPWRKEQEAQDLLQIDIGIMPLSDDIWAKGKCGFKALQYMALEIPAVIAPVGVNTEIVDQGENGFLCSTPPEWMDALEVLIKHKDQRRRMGEKGREKVLRAYSVRSNAFTVLGLFTKYN